MSNDFKFLTGHQVVEQYETATEAIRLTDPPYAGIIFSYGRVEFPEDQMDNENCTLSFDYTIHDDAGVEYVKEEFEHYLGDFLVELIMYGISKNEIVYTGGIDENRDDDINESDIE